MTRRVCLFTEGIQDRTFIARLLLERFGLNLVLVDAMQDAPWRLAFDTATAVKKDKAPHGGAKGKGSARDKKNPISPQFAQFYHNDTTLVWLICTDGCDNFANHLDVILEASIKNAPPDAIGLLIDADTQAPDKRLEQWSPTVRDTLQLHRLPLPVQWQPGEVAGAPAIGVFVMPNCSDQGTLEDLLLACARKAYPQLHKAADELVGKRSGILADFDHKERKEIEKPAGPNKVTLGVMGAFLKPGRTIQTSIQEHRWVSSETVALPALAPLIKFLSILLGISP